MAYSLGAVKAHVKQAAEYFGQKHGYQTVYGWRATGSVPNSDHPKGLALDFMGSQLARGNALVADLIANAESWNITYIIWQRRIWERNTGKWSPYSGPSAHTDHVHVSFGDTANVPAIPVVENPTDLDVLQSLRNVFEMVSTALKWSVDPQAQRRVLYFVIGAFMFFFAMWRLSAVKQAIRKVNTSA